jgi:hypothetical protein
MAARAYQEAETVGLNVSEHGRSGFPEPGVPAPGGSASESHGHLGNATPTHTVSASRGHNPPAVLA